jgi:hypothetical protein
VCVYVFIHEHSLVGVSRERGRKEENAAHIANERAWYIIRCQRTAHRSVKFHLWWRSAPPPWRRPGNSRPRLMDIWRAVKVRYNFSLAATLKLLLISAAFGSSPQSNCGLIAPGTGFPVAPPKRAFLSPKQPKCC